MSNGIATCKPPQVNDLLAKFVIHAAQHTHTFHHANTFTSLLLLLSTDRPPQPPLLFVQPLIVKHLAGAHLIRELLGVGIWRETPLQLHPPLGVIIIVKFRKRPPIVSPIVSSHWTQSLSLVVYIILFIRHHPSIIYILDFVWPAAVQLQRQAATAELRRRRRRQYCWWSTDDHCLYYTLELSIT